ncbi:MAG: tetratricopeptide repeat protein, partial [Planctomycetes bacterium]|nr:tetratricopeptide repeat protein [Planctomycetota bacterium]
MSVDLYQPCPCGGGKKIKFCCCQDIAQDLDKIIRALDGEQRAAALDQIGRLLASKGERAALLALKGEVQIQLGNLDDAKVTVDKFLELNPDNQVALALSSILESDNTAAITKLQRAIEQIDKDIPFAVYDALVVVGQALLSSGDILAAKRHLAVQATLSRNSDKRALELLMQIHSSPRIPLLMKQDIKIAERPSDVPWADAFDEAINNVSRGAWLRATEQLVALANDAPNEPAILKNIALFRGWLGDADATATAWHRYAQLENVPLDDAVEGEALGQLLDQDAESDTIDVVTVTYPLEDNERLKECLLSDRHVSQMPVDLGQLGDEDEPPPGAAFWLLDRPLPTTGTEIARDAVPHVLGELYIFGRQTDRQARLEFSVTRDDAFDSTTAKLSKVAGDLIGDPESEEVTGDVSMTLAQLLPQAKVVVVTTPQQAAQKVALRAGKATEQT